MSSNQLPASNKNSATSNFINFGIDEAEWDQIMADLPSSALIPPVMIPPPGFAPIVPSTSTIRDDTMPTPSPSPPPSTSTSAEMKSAHAKARLGNPTSPKPTSERSFLTSASLNSSFDHGGPAKLEDIVKGETIKDISAEEKPSMHLRPKTAAVRRRPSSGGKSFDSGSGFPESGSTRAYSYRSASTLRMRSQMNKDSESNCSTPVSRSSTSSLDDSLRAVIPLSSHPVLHQPRPKIQRSSTCMGPNIPKCLEQDKRFLDEILRDKGLRRSKTPYTRRVLHMAKDLKSFVSEREIYWKNREQFVRYAHEDDSDFET